MIGQEKCDILIQVTAKAGLTIIISFWQIQHRWVMLLAMQNWNSHQ